MATKDNTKDTSWAGSSHTFEDLRGWDLRDKVMFACDLRGSALYGAGVTLNCDSFDGLKLDDTQIATLLRVFALVDADTPAWRTGLEALVVSIIGAERNALLTRYLQIHA